jgi:hypothetical protein
MADAVIAAAKIMPAGASQAYQPVLLTAAAPKATAAATVIAAARPMSQFRTGVKSHILVALLLSKQPHKT